MESRSSADVRGREVVWIAGSLDDAGERRHRARRVAGQLTALIMIAGLAAGLLAVVASWSVIHPVGVPTTTPLWVAPATVHAPAPLRPAPRPSARSTGSPTAGPSPRSTATAHRAERATDDHRSAFSGRGHSGKSGKSRSSDDG